MKIKGLPEKYEKIWKKALPDFKKAGQVMIFIPKKPSS